MNARMLVAIFAIATAAPTAHAIDGPTRAGRPLIVPISAATTAFPSGSSAGQRAEASADRPFGAGTGAAASSLDRELGTASDGGYLYYEPERR